MMAPYAATTKTSLAKTVKENYPKSANAALRVFFFVDIFADAKSIFLPAGKIDLLIGINSI